MLSVANFLQALRVKFRKDEQVAERIDRLQRQLRHMVLEVPEAHKPVMRMRCVEEFHRTMSPLYVRIERNDHSLVKEIDHPMFKELELDQLFFRCNDATRAVMLAHLNVMREHAVVCMAATLV